MKIRKELKLYANVRPVNYYASITDSSPLKKEIIEETVLPGVLSSAKSAKSISTSTIKDYCAFYDITYYDSLEYKNEIRDVMEDRNIYSSEEIETYVHTNKKKVRKVPKFIYFRYNLDK